MCFSLASSRSAAERIAPTASACRPWRAPPTQWPPGAGFDLLRPVRVLRLAEGVVKRLELLDVTAGTGQVSAARRPERPAEVDDRLRLREAEAPRLQRRRLGPAPALDGVPDRDRREGGLVRQPHGHELLDRVALVNDALGLMVLRELQVRVDPEILRVEPEGLAWRCFAAYSLEAASAAVFDLITSCHRPSTVKMCEGMWSACGAEGAMAA